MILKNKNKKYRDMFKKLSNENRKKRIEKYNNKIVSKMYHTICYEKKIFSTFFVDWIIFKKNVLSFEFDIQKIEKNTFRNLLTTITINNENETIESNYINDEWYSNIYKYYAWNQTFEINKTTMTTFKRKINIYRYDETNKRLLHKYKNEYCVCLQKKRNCVIVTKSA